MGRFIKHVGCEECGSSDANALYEEEFNKVSSHCFSCGHSIQNTDKPNFVLEDTEEEEEEMEQVVDLESIDNLPTLGIKERGITKSLAEYFGMKTAKRGQGDKITHHYYPYTSEGKIIGYQERDVVNKSFRSVGRGSGKMELQGQHLWPNGGGKHLTIVEGFLDMMAASQMLHGKLPSDKRYAVVSLPAGASNLQAIKNQKNLEWINSFDKVHLMLDQDEPGRKAAELIAKYCKPGVVYISQFSEKDACDMLKNRKTEEFKESFWNAVKYSPADIVSAGDARRILAEENEVPSMPYPAFAAELNMGLVWVSVRERSHYSLQVLVAVNHSS